MKKLTQWIVGVNILSILWLSLLFNQYDSKISKEHFLVIQFLPIILLISFGVSICENLINTYNFHYNTLMYLGFRVGSYTV